MYLPVMYLPVYILPRGSNRSMSYAEGTAFVGTEIAGERKALYYEGNYYDAVNLNLFTERVHCAAGRLTARYPTTAVTFISNAEIESDFLKVGLFDTQKRTTLLSVDGLDQIKRHYPNIPIGPHEIEHGSSFEFIMGNERHEYRCESFNDALALFGSLVPIKPEMLVRSGGLLCIKDGGEAQVILPGKPAPGKSGLSM